MGPANREVTLMNHDSNIPRDLRAWTKALVARYGIRAGERLGQHFLIDRSVVEAVAGAAGLTPSATVLEVGGGLGVLTLALLERAKKVVTVELDPRLAAGLRKLDIDGRLAVVEGDILRLSDGELRRVLELGPREEFVIAANLPYEISGAFLKRFVSGPMKPARLTVLLQKEVAERISAKPGQGSLLWLMVQLYADVEVVRLVPPGAFWPAPKVTSALVRLNVKTAAEIAGLIPSPAFEGNIWRLARVGFASRRKLLANNLASAFQGRRDDISRLLREAGLGPTARAQELSVGEWRTLAAVAGRLGILSEPDKNSL